MLPTTADGQCDGDGGTGGLVLFGEAMARTCTTKLSAAALASWCQDVLPQNQPLIKALNLSWVTSTVPAYIGVFGDSHPDSTSFNSDWVSLEVTTRGSLRPEWIAGTQTCANVLSGIHLKVLTANVGSVTAPATKVIGAQLHLSSQTVSSARCPLGQSCETVVSVTATTTFAALEDNTYDFIPPTPTIIPPLSADFFYPFLMRF